MRYGRDTSREYAVEEREKRRAFETGTAAALAESGMSEIERKQAGETRRAQMKIEADRQVAERKADADRQVALAKGVTTTKGGVKGAMTADQMAKHRTGALKQSKEGLESMRNPVTGVIAHPATGMPMTPVQESEYIKLEADNLLKYSLGGSEIAPATGEPAPTARGWAETESGRKFEVAPMTERGFVETTPQRTPMAPAAMSPPSGGVPSAEESPSSVVAPPVVPVPAAVAQVPGEAAAGLRGQYEAQQQAAMPKPLQTAGRAVSKYLRSNILSRRSYTPGQRAGVERSRTTAPLGLRGFMENRYGK